MELDEIVKVAILNKYYGNLLTSKQKTIVNMYVDNNLSLKEVSEELGITRQAIKDALDKALDTLNDAENRLNFISRDEKIKSILKNDTMDYKQKILAILED